MTYNKNKGISSITYNAINQPEKITFADGKTTEYVYSYDGTKLQTIHKTLQPQTSTTTTYCKNLIYENDALKQMLVDGGNVTFSGATPVYHFYIQDHLGNNRVVAKADGTVEQINHYYPFGGLMADICTGSDIQPYKYSGKELDRMHGLDTYDYGARQHNAATGRWDRIDPLAEENPEVSPYVYCRDNPVNAIDPDGKKVYLYATKLPGAPNLFSLATHTFIVVTGSNGNIRGYYAFGSEYDGIKGALEGRLMMRRYQQNLDVFYGKNTESLKQKMEIAAPDNMEQQTFDDKVISVAESFGNNIGIRYNIVPTKTTEGNCNTSTSTILLKSGISPKYIESIKEEISGFSVGFDSFARPWTKEEQEKTVEYEKLIQEIDKAINKIHLQ